MIRYILLSTVLLVLTLVAGDVRAQIDLRFTPQDTTIATDDTCHVSVMLDDAVFFRTIELTVTYDPALVESVTGRQGELFSSSGFLIWEGFEESTPGRWHGFAVIIGATDSLSGPGELFVWDLVGTASGDTPITAIEALVYDPQAAVIPDVSLAATTLQIRTISGVPSLAPAGPELTLQPNPFNPMTRINFDLAHPAEVELSVFDPRGRRVAILHRGPVGAGPFSADWNGLGDNGLPQPAGLYLFRLQPVGDPGWTPVVTKGILLE